MMGREDEQSNILGIDFVESWAQKPVIPRDSIYYTLSRADNVFNDDLFADAYSKTGTSSIPPSRMIKVLMLQALENVSDREAENRALYDLRWKAALKIGLNESGFDYSSLSVFRSRLLLKGKEREAFEAVLRVAVETGLVSEDKLTQIFDSTYVLGAGAVQDTYSLIGLTIRKLMKQVGSRFNILSCLPKPLSYDYKRVNKKPKINWDSVEERSELLNNLVNDTQMVLSVMANLNLTKEETDLKNTLETVIAQDTIVSEQGKVEIVKGVAKDRLISTTDPEMRHGRKSSSKRFDGYKAHTAIDEASEFITNVTVTPGNVHDSEAVVDLIDNQPVLVSTEAIIGDSAYGTGKVRSDMEERQIDVVAPVNNGPTKPGMFSKAQFEIDLDAETCRCPWGLIALQKSYSRKDHKLKSFIFTEDQCRYCELRENCISNEKGRRTISVNEYERQLQDGRAYQKTEEFDEIYSTRYKVERKQAEMVRHGLRKARFIGKEKVTLQALMIATLVNFKLFAKLTPAIT